MALTAACTPCTQIFNVDFAAAYCANITRISNKDIVIKCMKLRLLLSYPQPPNSPPSSLRPDVASMALNENRQSGYRYKHITQCTKHVQPSQVISCQLTRQVITSLINSLQVLVALRIDLVIQRWLLDTLDILQYITRRFPRGSTKMVGDTSKVTINDY